MASRSHPRAYRIRVEKNDNPGNPAMFPDRLCKVSTVSAAATLRRTMTGERDGGEEGGPGHAAPLLQAFVLCSLSFDHHLASPRSDIHLPWTKTFLPYCVFRKTF
jgi:hypothetical protein